MSGDRRLPDFVVIGAMKAGTSSLYQWLACQPEVTLPATKEPHFFSRDQVWERGLDWYSSLFSTARSQLVGEASTTYTNPELCSMAASRMAEVVPSARLIYVLRHPVERLRSHYRHMVVHGTEKRPLAEVLADPTNQLVRRSKYFACLDPYTRLFSREQICIVRMEDLLDPKGSAWPEVLAHLGLDGRPAPGSAHNVSASRGHFTPVMRWIHRSSLHGLIPRIPSPARQVGRRVLLRSGQKYQARLAGSEVPIADTITLPIWRDIERLEAWMHLDGPLWQRQSQCVEEH